MKLRLLFTLLLTAPLCHGMDQQITFVDRLVNLPDDNVLDSLESYKWCKESYVEQCLKQAQKINKQHEPRENDFGTIISIKEPVHNSPTTQFINADRDEICDEPFEPYTILMHMQKNCEKLKAHGLDIPQILDQSTQADHNFSKIFLPFDKMFTFSEATTLIKRQSNYFSTWYLALREKDREKRVELDTMKQDVKTALDETKKLREKTELFIDQSDKQQIYAETIGWVSGVGLAAYVGGYFANYLNYLPRSDFGLSAFGLGLIGGFGVSALIQQKKDAAQKILTAQRDVLKSKQDAQAKFVTMYEEFSKNYAIKKLMISHAANVNYNHALLRIKRNEE